MDTPLTLEQFVSVLEDSGLIEAARLGTLVREFQDSEVAPDASRLAETLIARKLLTLWQAEKLLAGVQEGFFLNKYKLLRLVASGSMSSVYEAEHTLMGQRVAIKILPKSLVGQTSYLERFYREARAMALLNHPNIVRGFDVGQDGEYHYLVMEYIQGRSLYEIVESRGSLPSEQAVELIRQAAIGLGHAHQAGLVHRDIKPSNLLLDTTGTVKLLDLGLVRSLPREDDGQAALTHVHDERILGTIDYLSPEQAVDSHGADVRSDIYSLGCTFYYLLAGSPPFPEGTLAQRLLAHQSRMPPMLSARNPATPASVDSILRKMMAKRPDDRFQTAGEVAKVLDDWLGKWHERRERNAAVAAAKASSAAAGVARPPEHKPGGEGDSAAVATTTPPAPAPSGDTARGRSDDRAPKEAAGTPTPPQDGGSSLTDPGRAPPPLDECWRKWTTVVVTVLTERRSPPIGEEAYQALYKDLLRACRRDHATAEEARRGDLKRLEAAVIPWLTVRSLTQINNSEASHSLFDVLRELEQRLNLRPTVPPESPNLLWLVLGIVALLVLMLILEWPF